MSKHQDQRVQKLPINRPPCLPSPWCPCLAHTVIRKLERTNYGRQDDLALKPRRPRRTS